MRDWFPVGMTNAQARRQEALLHSAPPSDPAWNDQLESERQREIQVIGDACTKLGREIHEVGLGAGTESLATR